MRTRRTVALGLSAVMAVSVLSGCGSSSSSTTADTKGESNASAESSTEPVVLHWWGSFAENMGPEQVCEAFNKIDPNLQVEYTRYVNDDAGNTKLDMTLMSDDSIDVFLNMNDVLLMKRIENGYMYPLDELFEGLQYTGIGGKKSSGLGRFIYKVCKVPEDMMGYLKKKSEKNILLSTALPEDEELEQVMKGSSYLLIKRSGFVDSSEYALQQMRKRDLYVFSSGSCFAHTFRGRIIEERNGGKHPVFRYAKAFFMGV